MKRTSIIRALTYALCLAAATHEAHAQLTIECPAVFATTGTLTLQGLDLYAYDNDVEMSSPIYTEDCRLELPRASRVIPVKGNTALALDTLHTLSFFGGMATLERDLYLVGNIEGEDAKNTFTAESGTHTIRKHVVGGGTALQNTGLGLSLTFFTDHKAVLITRHHDPTTRRDKTSVGRRYEFSPAIAGLNPALDCPAADIAAMSNPQLYYRHITKGTWEQIYESQRESAESNTVSGGKFPASGALTVFDVEDIYTPAFFTPNGDGINDYYEIENSYKYEDSRLVVITRDGKVVYDKSPYRNDFDGNGCKEDTYYFIFYRSKTDTRPKKWAVDVYR